MHLFRISDMIEVEFIDPGELSPSPSELVSAWACPAKLAVKSSRSVPVQARLNDSHLRAYQYGFPVSTNLKVFVSIQFLCPIVYPASIPSAWVPSPTLKRTLRCLQDSNFLLDDETGVAGSGGAHRLDFPTQFMMNSWLKIPAKRLPLTSIFPDCK